MARLNYVGEVALYFDPDSNTLKVDPEDLENAAVGADVYGDDDVGDDYGDDDDDDDLGDDDLGDDDEAGDDAYDVEGEDEVGGRRAKRRRARRKARRAARKAGRSSNKGGGMSGHWEQHVRAGSQTTSGTTAVDFTIANNSDFKCGDMSFEGSDSGARVSQIWFGDDCVYNPGSGIPVSMFGPTSTLRGSLKGKLCPAGAAIRVVGTVATAGDELDATFLGKRYVKKSC